MTLLGPGTPKSAVSKTRACLRYAAHSVGAGAFLPMPSAQYIAKQAVS